MLHTILKSVGSGCPKVLPNWDKAVMTIALRTEIMKTRFLGTGFLYNNGMNMLKHILSTVVNQDMLNMSSDFTRYVERVDPFTASFRGMYDPVYNARQSKNLFTTDNRIPEFIMNVSMDKPLTSLPMDKPWNEWKDLCPIRVIYHDSRELVSNIYRFSIDFQHDAPHCIIYSLDINMLVMMYAKYLDYSKSVGMTGSVEDFLQSHVVIKWFEDLRRIWLTNIIKDIVADEFDPARYNSDEFVAPKAMLKTIAVDMQRFMDDAKRKAISIGDFCKTKWFGDYSLQYWLDELNTNIQLPSLRQYTWLEFITTLPYAELVLFTLLKIGRQDTNLAIRNLMFDLHQYKNQNICSSIMDPGYRQYCAKELDRVLECVTDTQSSL